METVKFPKRSFDYRSPLKLVKLKTTFKGCECCGRLRGIVRVFAIRNYNRVTTVRRYIKDRIMSLSCERAGEQEMRRRNSG